MNALEYEPRSSRGSSSLYKIDKGWRMLQRDRTEVGKKEGIREKGREGRKKLGLKTTRR